MKKNNTKGSTLITGVIVVMILLIITGTVLSIAYSYHVRSLNEYTRKQAYLNAVGVADVVAKQINEGETRLTPTTEDTEKEITKVNIVPQDGTTNWNTGEITGVVKLDEETSDICYIQITSKVNNQTEEVQIIMQNKYGTWYKVAYTKIGETLQ